MFIVIFGIGFVVGGLYFNFGKKLSEVVDIFIIVVIIFFLVVSVGLFFFLIYYYFLICKKINS